MLKRTDKVLVAFLNAIFFGGCYFIWNFHMTGQINHQPEFYFKTMNGIPETINLDTTYLQYNATFPVNATMSQEITVVTAYWNLGSFQKGDLIRNSNYSYFIWASTFKYLSNSVIVYTDCKIFKKLMQDLRETGNLTNVTEVFLVDRENFWPFQILNETQEVYQQPGYPEFAPNTISPEYTAAQHFKYVAVSESARRNPFNTSYFAWLDVGYFRDIVSLKQQFRLKLPPNFNPSRIALNRVYDQSLQKDPEEIFRQNLVLVGGGLFICSRKIGIEFEKLYRKAVMYFLQQKIMNTDQQVIYAMYSEHGQKYIKPSIGLQMYIPQGGINRWFYFGYLCGALENYHNKK
uniref:Uncharacterized protein LOC111124962 isoform X4 n=1 Tax=Crassostrea virginica TaxID=6565 RepID=A0A8B8D9P9_CRAVI|nr:uncharacterized protein LOC111124962 isoform X4 [Crassostrea virginica]